MSRCEVEGTGEVGRTGAMIYSRSGGSPVHE